MDKIYSTEELHERFRLHQFLYTYFTPCKRSQSELTGYLTPEIVLDYYKEVCKKDSILTVAMVKHVLLFGGFLEEEANPQFLYVKIKAETFKQLPAHIQRNIITMVREEKLGLRLRQLALGFITNVEEPHGTLSYYIQAFMDTCVIDRRNKYYSAMQINDRGTLSHVYEYFCDTLVPFRIPLPTKKIFANALREMNYKIVKGYINGVSGIVYVKDVFIPNTPEDILLSRELGTCVILDKRNNMHYTGMNILLEDMTPAHKEDAMRRFKGRFENYVKIETGLPKQETPFDRGAVKRPTVSTERTEEAIYTSDATREQHKGEDILGEVNRNISTDQDAQDTKKTDRESVAEHIDTGSRTIVCGASNGKGIPSVNFIRDEDAALLASIRDIADEDEGADRDVISNSDDSVAEELTLEDVVKGLYIVKKILPECDIDFIQNWLESSGSTLDAVVVYEALLKYKED